MSILRFCTLVGREEGTEPLNLRINEANHIDSSDVESDIDKS